MQTTMIYAPPYSGTNDKGEKTSTRQCDQQHRQAIPQQGSMHRPRANKFPAIDSVEEDTPMCADTYPHGLVGPRSLHLRTSNTSPQANDRPTCQTIIHQYRMKRDVRLGAVPAKKTGKPRRTQTPVAFPSSTVLCLTHGTAYLCT